MLVCDAYMWVYECTQRTHAEARAGCQVTWTSRPCFSARVLNGMGRRWDGEEDGNAGSGDLKPSKLLKCTASYVLYPEEKWNQVSGNYHIMGQSQQECSQAMLYGREHRLAQVHHRPCTSWLWDWLLQSLLGVDRAKFLGTKTLTS